MAESINRRHLDKILALTGAGMGAGAGLATGTAIAGANVGFFGSALGALGFAATASNPVGWLVGGAMIGATILYGGSKAVGAKGFSDGDIKAFRTFNSDIEKKLYMTAVSKLSQKDSVVAKDLLSRIPIDYNEWKDSAIEGLQNGTMPATEIISMCCEILEEDINDYLSPNDFSSDDIELTIKLAMLMALADGEVTDEEMELIKNHTINFFELETLLNSTEIDLIFSQAIGTDEQIKQLKAMSFNEIKNLFIVFLFTMNNNRLIDMLVNFLYDIIFADGVENENEAELYKLFNNLILSKSLIKLYIDDLKEINNSESFDLFSINNSNPDKFLKKRNNALNAYAKNILGEMIISLYDATVFGKGDKGFIITQIAIITDSENSNILPFSDIYDVKLDEELGIVLYGEPNNNNEMEAIYVMHHIDEKKDIFKFLEAISNTNNSYKGYIKDENDDTTNPLDTTEKWYLAQTGNQLGLHSLASINAKFANGNLFETDLLVWKDGMPEWLLATEVDEINSIIKRYKVVTPPPLPS